jgi:hypothetical protein
MCVRAGILYRIFDLKMGEEIEYFIRLTISVLEKSKYFQELDLTNFLMCSADLNMGTTGVTTHITTIFSFSPGTGKHFFGNALFSCDDCHASHLHLHFFTKNSVFYKPSE